VLWQIGGSWVALYIGTDMGLYLLVKILRGDFWYWVPLGGKTEIISSLLVRVTIKIITDFTSIVQFRHPNEIGGAYWLFGFVLTLGSLPIATIIAQSIQQQNEGIIIAWSVVGYISPLMLICFAVFIWNIEHTYLSTFFSLQTGIGLTVKNFKTGSDDSVKAMYSFGRSRNHWISIEDEVRGWVEANWERWEEEKPTWFDDMTKSKVPVEFIPITGDARRRESVRRASLDAEAEGGLGGVLRASIRRASIGSAVEHNEASVVPMNGDN
jgi:hypothetical protein